MKAGQKGQRKAGMKDGRQKTREERNQKMVNWMPITPPGRS